MQNGWRHYLELRIAVVGLGSLVVHVIRRILVPTVGDGGYSILLSQVLSRQRRPRRGLVLHVPPLGERRARVVGPLFPGIRVHARAEAFRGLEPRLSENVNQAAGNDQCPSGDAQEDPEGDLVVRGGLVGACIGRERRSSGGWRD